MVQREHIQERLACGLRLSVLRLDDGVYSDQQLSRDLLLRLASLRCRLVAPEYLILLSATVIGTLLQLYITCLPLGARILHQLSTQRALSMTEQAVLGAASRCPSCSRVWTCQNATDSAMSG